MRPSKPAGRNRRIVQWLVLFVASLFVVDGLVGDRGLLAIMRARREYDTAAATVARQRAETARREKQGACARIRGDRGDSLTDGPHQTGEGHCYQVMSRQSRNALPKAFP